VDIKKKLWFILGIILVGIAYLGIVLPGIPWSTPAVGAAYCFAKSSDRMHKWIYGHRIFGPFLMNWEQKKVFPTKMKYMMAITMIVSLSFLWFTTANLTAIVWSGSFMILVCVWGWRYPGSIEEYEKRVEKGKRIAWLK